MTFRYFLKHNLWNICDYKRQHTCPTWEGQYSMCRRITVPSSALTPTPQAGWGYFYSKPSQRIHDIWTLFKWL